MKKYWIGVALLLWVSLSAMAQERTPRADTRQKVQRVRIAEGRRSGELTSREAAGLNAQQRHIRRSERRAKADGDVTARERVKLERKQDRANRNISRQKNDTQSRPN